MELSELKLKYMNNRGQFEYIDSPHAFTGNTEIVQEL